MLSSREYAHVSNVMHFIDVYAMQKRKVENNEDQTDERTEERNEEQSEESVEKSEESGEESIDTESEETKGYYLHRKYHYFYIVFAEEIEEAYNFVQSVYAVRKRRQALETLSHFAHKQ